MKIYLNDVRKVKYPYLGGYRIKHYVGYPFKLLPALHLSFGYNIMNATDRPDRTKKYAFITFSWMLWSVMLEMCIGERNVQGRDWDWKVYDN